MTLIPTVGAFLQRLNIAPAVTSGVLGMLSHVLPGEICTQAVDLSPVMANEENKILRCQKAGSTTRCQRASLYDLEIRWTAL